MTEILLQKLILYIDGNKSRIKCLSSMIISLISGSSIHQKGLALGINNKAKATSKSHRVYSFFKEFSFNYIQVAAFILSLFGEEQYIVAMDRTNWKFGKTDINILFLVIVIGKISVPIYWQSLAHGGGCSAEFMEGFLQRFINGFNAKKIKYLLADREFMSRKWLDFLFKNKIDFVIPLKKDHKVRIKNELRTIAVKRIFNDLRALGYKTLEGILWDKNVSFAAYKNDRNELMVLVSSFKTTTNIFALYKYRWSIERLFKHLKSGGFDIERSHLTILERFEKLLVVASIASALIVKNGLIQNALNPIPIKRQKTAETIITKQLFSLFTYGFDRIKYIFTKNTNAIDKLIHSILEPPNTSFLLLFYHSLLNS